MNKHSANLPGRIAAFTLVEMLAVLAIIGVLVAVMLPVIGVAQRAVSRSKTRAQLLQYMLAYEGFRAEYGYYPTMGESTAKFKLHGHNAVFIETLSGAGLSGGAMGNDYALKANPRHARYLTIGESELAPAGAPYAGEIVDASGNPNLVVIIDRDRNGLIEASELADIPAADRPGPIHASVVMYVENPEGNPDWHWVFSWE
ncbi:MAG: type II secretion system protein [Verrucomicrobiota bacterium]|nr:type II secretion system protein [Verrucomicrobiota bacterium]